MAKEFEIKGEWINSKSDQKYVAKAVTKKGRILVTLTIDVPIEVGAAFSFLYGSETLKPEVEKAAQEQARIIAEATPEE